MERRSSAEKSLDLALTNMRRNPHLVDYVEYKRARERSVSERGERRSTTARRNAVVRRNAAAQRRNSVPGSIPAQRTSPAQPASARFSSRTAAGNARRLAAEKRRRQLFYRKLALLTGIAIVLVFGAVLLVWNVQKAEAHKSVNTDAETIGQDLPGNLSDNKYIEKVQGIDAADFGKHPTWTEDFLTPNEYSRPGEPLEQVNSIFVHYTANRGTSAAQNRSYFEQLKDTHETSASAHFIIGYEGEIIQCIPLDEIAYAVQTRNYDSISIECCYLEEDGSFTQETYDSLIALLRWLMDVYDLDREDVLRHYDCGGKKCPLYYTDNPDAWERLKKEL